MQEVRNDLIEQERLLPQAVAPASVGSSVDVSFAAFVVYGLELEDAQ